MILFATIALLSSLSSHRVVTGTDYAPIDELTVSVNSATKVVSGKFLLDKKYNGSWADYGQPEVYITTDTSLGTFLNKVWAAPSGVVKITPTSGSRIVDYTITYTTAPPTSGLLLLLLGSKEHGHDVPQRAFFAAQFPNTSSPGGGGLPGTTVPLTDEPTLYASLNPSMVDQRKILNHGKKKDVHGLYTFATKHGGALGPTWATFSPGDLYDTPKVIKFDSPGEDYAAYRREKFLYSITDIRKWSTCAGVIRNP